MITAMARLTSCPPKPEYLIRRYILKAIESDSAIPDNNQANTKLNDIVEKCSLPPQAFPVHNFPELSQTISGVKYNIEPNDIGFNNISFNFGLNDSVATMEYGLEDKQYTVEIGLDGVYRITAFPEGTAEFEGGRLNQNYIYIGNSVAFRGDWLNEDTFMFSYINVGHTSGTSGEIKFTGDTAEISMIGPSGDRIRLKGVRE